MDKVKVSRKFVADFDLVAEYYQCTPEEIEEMKQCAREHLDEAITCFSALAMEIA